MGKVLERAQVGGISVRPTLYSREDKSDQLHYHETSYLTFVLRGGVLAKSSAEEIDCVPGTLTFYHAGESHQCLNGLSKTKSINFEVEPRFYRENTITEGMLKSSISKNPNVKFAMLKVYNELLVGDEFSECTMDMLLLGLIDGKYADENQRPVWIEKVTEALNDRWNEEVTLKDLSDVAGVHPITISKHFSKYFSCTFGEYRRRLKVEKALHLIKTSNFSLTEIALDCGFYDQSHFTRTFKQLTGFLPRHYGTL